MRKLVLFSFLLFSFTAFSQTWTEKQLTEANTAKSHPTLSKIEKETILYMNLARLYPKEFVKIELQNYMGSPRYNENINGSKYKASLIAELKKMEPVGALIFDVAPYENAKCLAKEQSKNGLVGHKRTKCKDGPYAECCSYGMDTGKDVVMQWLIDDNQPALGHRKICLGKRYTKVGVCEQSHKKWDTCSVADFM